MALTTPVTLAATTVGSGTAAVTTGAYTPTANGLQLVIISATGSIGGETLLSVSSTHTGTGAWNFVGFAATASSKVSVWIAYAVTGASPGSGTFTANVNGTGATDVQITPCETTGQDTTTPVDTAAGASNPLGNATTATTPSLTLNTAPATGDLTIGAFAARNVTTSITAGTGFTALVANSHATPTASQMLEYRTGSTSTTVAAVGMGTVANAGVALIVKVAAGGTPYTASGVVANITLAAPAGTVSAPVNLVGPVANITLGAPAGAVSAPKNMAGPVSTLALGAPAGTVSAPKNLVGPVANITLGAPAGTVSAGSTTPYTASGVVAAITLAAPAGAVSAPKNLVGPAANIALTAPAGTVTAGGGGTPVSLAGIAANITLGAPAGAVLLVAGEIHFSPPLKRSFSDPSDVWWRHTTSFRTSSILKFGSIYEAVEGPSNEQIEVADVTYLGGHVYVIDATEAAALTAAGYGAGLS